MKENKKYPMKQFHKSNIEINIIVSIEQTLKTKVDQVMYLLKIGIG